MTAINPLTERSWSGVLTAASRSAGEPTTTAMQPARRAGHRLMPTMRLASSGLAIRLPMHSAMRTTTSTSSALVLASEPSGR